MIGDNNHGFGKKAHAFGLHHRSDTGQRFPCSHHMVEQTCPFLNGAPDRIFLMRTQLDGFGSAHQFKVGTVISWRHVGIEPLVVEFGKHVASLVIDPDPIEESLFDFIGLLHGGGCQFLVDDHDGPALVVTLSAFLLHLDGLVHEQGFDNLSGGIFGNAPYAGGKRSIPYADGRFPAPQRRQVTDGLHPLAAVQVFHEVGKDLRRNPGGTESDADVHGFDVRRHGGGQGFHIGSETDVRLGCLLCLAQFGPDIAGQVSVADFPFLGGGIQENLSLVAQLRLNVFRRTIQEPRHTAEIHSAVFPQGNEQGILDGFRMFHDLGGLEYPLAENGGFFR